MSTADVVCVWLWRAAFLISTRMPVAQLATLPRRSNVILIYADDFGFDIAGFGHPTVVTNNMDRMILEGAKLTQYYSGENVCTPSRGAVR